MGAQAKRKNERRRFERVKLENPRQCRNISEGGLYMLTNRPRRLGSVVNFELKLLDRYPPIRGRGRVVRVIHEAGAVGVDPPGMAIQFVELAPADRDRIRTLVVENRREKRDEEPGTESRLM